jgi:integrase
MAQQSGELWRWIRPNDSDERWGKASSAAVWSMAGSAVTRLAIKLMALTFVRISELIGAKWAERWPWTKPITHRGWTGDASAADHGQLRSSIAKQILRARLSSAIWGAIHYLCHLHHRARDESVF